MKQWWKRGFLMALTALFLVSCGKDVYDFGDEGEVTFALHTEYKTASVVKAPEGSLNIDDFTLEIFNQEGVKIKKWKYSEVKETSVRLNAGYKKAVAYYGDAKATGFDAIYFAGESEFYVNGQSSTPVAITCKQANVEIAVEWGSYIKEGYTDYKARVYREGESGELIFTKDETKSGYIPAGELQVEITLIDANNNSRVYKATPITGNANDYIKLKIDTQDPVTGEVSVNISVEVTTNDKVTEVIIPGAYVAKEAPSFTYAGHAVESSTIINETEGNSASNVIVTLNAPGVLQSCILTSSVSVGGVDNWPAEIDLMGSDQTNLELLESCGLSWDFTNLKAGTIDFSNFVKSLRVPAAGGSNKITIKLTDQKGKESSCDIIFNVTAATVSLTQIPQYDVWATKAYVTVSTQDGVAENLSLQIKSGAGEWTTPQMNEVSVDQTSKRIEITSLTPGTEYQVRAVHLSSLSTEATITTEAAAQVANSDFETWCTWQYKVYILGNTTQNNYGPYAAQDSKWWDSNNSETTPGNRTNSGANYKSFPMVTYVAGNGSSRAAQIMTIAISSTATSFSAPSPTVRAGRLFLGDYDAGTTGRAFTSRPTSISFDYKYAPQGSDSFEVTVSVLNGETVIGTGTLTSSAEVNSWSNAKVNITYSNTTLLAESIEIEFKSSNSTGTPPWVYNKSITYGGTETANVHGGSILTVDNLQMVY